MCRRGRHSGKRGPRCASLLYYNRLRMSSLTPLKRFDERAHSPHDTISVGSSASIGVDRLPGETKQFREAFVAEGLAVGCHHRQDLGRRLDDHEGTTPTDQFDSRPCPKLLGLDLQRGKLYDCSDLARFDHSHFAVVELFQDDHVHSTTLSITAGHAPQCPTGQGLQIEAVPDRYTTPSSK